VYGRLRTIRAARGTGACLPHVLTARSAEGPPEPRMSAAIMHANAPDLEGYEISRGGGEPHAVPDNMILDECRQMYQNVRVPWWKRK